jgi:hypothetical protein
MPNPPGLTTAEALRAKLLAELAAKKKAREEEDAAALKALEEHIAKEAAAAAAARMREHEEAMALVRAEKRKVTMRDDGVELVEVRLCFFSLLIFADCIFRNFMIRRARSARERGPRWLAYGERMGTAACGAKMGSRDVA